MFLNSGFDPTTQVQSFGHSGLDMYLDDVSRQLSPNFIRRSSRGSTGTRTGGSMRIVKTNSTRNSPQSTTLNRRKTVMNDTPYRRRQMGEQMVSVPGFFDAVHSQSRISRPQSWHPASYLIPQVPSYPLDSTVPKYDIPSVFNTYELPPTPAAFSGYTSPSSTFSPLPQPLPGYEQEQYPFSDNFAVTLTPLDTNNVYVPFQPSALRYQTESQNMPIPDDMDSSYYSQMEWKNFAINGFGHTTAPATPQDPLPMPHQDPSFETEETIPYQSLEDLEDDGEELVGMGLYDTPEKPVPSDSQLDNYRTLMMTQLLGSAYRKQESTGKGLKLEETWNPPPSDDEDDDEADQDEDAEGSIVNEL